MKRFNTTGLCIPSEHYMVSTQSRVDEIVRMVDNGDYFTINRARQYGKTTLLNALKNTLQTKYFVVSLDFQGISYSGFSSEESFVKAISRLINRECVNGLSVPEKILTCFNDIISRKEHSAQLDELFDVFNEWCSLADKPIVLIIDEVDSAANNQVFLDFLAQMRYGYLKRKENTKYNTFQSVILAGVTDVKHLKSKIRDEDQHKVNSPWNIASDFDVDMSFHKEEIEVMLKEYEEDHHTGMDASEMAQLLEDYTSGYPFLVSRLCQLLDEKVSKIMKDKTWTRDGMDEAVKMILSEDNTLFQSLTGKLQNLKEIRNILYRVLMNGERFAYNAQQEYISQMHMYGFVYNDSGSLRISNRIFETLLYNLFLSDEELRNNAFYSEGSLEKNMFVSNGILNIPLVMERFIRTYTEIYGPLEDRFSEKDGRELFLLYLKPIINGTGNYYIEAETRDRTRTDIIVDYLGKQYVIELKIWRGQRYNEEGEKQILEYLGYYNLDTGYMMSFNFNKKKEAGVKRITIGNKVLFEGML